MREAARELERYWKRQAPHFKLNANKYRAPLIIHKVYPRGMYFRVFNNVPQYDGVILGRPGYNYFLRHECNHKIHYDCAFQTMEELMHRDNPKLRALIIKRTAQKPKWMYNRVYRALANKSCLRSRRHAMEISTYLIWLNLKPAWVEAFANALEPFGKFNLRKAVALTAALPLCSVLPAIVIIITLALFPALFKLSIIPLILVAILCICFGLSRGRGLLSAYGYVKKVARAPPEVRRFCFLGPQKEESLENFIKALRSGGAM